MRLAHVIWAGTCVLLLASCAGGRPTGVQLPLPALATGKATRHAAQSEQLRTIMRELRDLSFDRVPQELEDPNGRDARLRQAVLMADELSEASVRIASVTDEVGLSPEQQGTFLALASRLGRSAQTLSDDARHGDSRRVDRAMDEIDDTCVACHDLFRSPSGTSEQ